MTHNKSKKISNRKNGLGSVALSVFALGLMTSVAQAQCCADYAKTTDVTQSKNDVISDLTTKINAMQLAIVEALRLGSGQSSGNSKEQIAAQANMKNTEDDRNTVRAIEMARYNAIQSAASGASSCSAITGARAGGSLAGNVNAMANAVAGDLSNWDIGAAGMPSAQGPDIAIQSRLAQHCALYANSEDINSGLCQKEGQFPNADIDISKSLFYVKNNENGRTLSPERMKAAQLFLINAIIPRPQGAMLPKEATTTGGREKAAQRQAATARNSVAMETVANIMAKRTPQNADEAKKWAESMAGQLTGQRYDLSNGVSWMDHMDVAAKQWYLNPNWGIKTDGYGFQQAVKDIAMQGAFSAYMQWETYQQMERTNLLLATILGIQAEQSRAPNLIAGAR